ncbi:hypothetical protein BO71DRAFT_454579 [Aspergillus ellipticus CBS 707.79]|uniref:Protein kinase domain-containing protein n=1 Tax=Aspergillus ellipticus CBS 707.79 TaxID=1448320 RepID=A0A319CQV1_9EURO|nr:hypothetical protein BO71DRAFT_454579 [Aspergillus ellipticus CBS 707.79]
MEPGAPPSKDKLIALLKQATEQTKQAKREQQQALEQRQNQKTTFAEDLQACHRFITKPLTVQTDLSLTTKGPITSPAGRVCPDFLRPFDFRKIQQGIFDEVYQTFHSPSPLRSFPSMPILEDRGKQACDHALASEGDLARHQEAEVETPVKEIIEQLLQAPEDRLSLPLGEGIAFENHANTITENPEGPTTPQAKKPVRPPTDRNCVYLKTGDHRSLLYIIEYKAAHKLTDAFLRASLRPMNVAEEVVQRVTIPTDPDERLRYESAFISAAAATQTYEYMMKAGHEWDMLTNGHMKVILRIPEEDPKTLEYDLLEPGRDAEPNSHDDYGFRFPYTAVSYQLGLTLIALQSPQRSQTWRDQVIDKLSRWEVDFELALRSIPESERKASPPGSEYQEPFYPINNRSPYLLRRSLVLGSPRPIQSQRSPSPNSSGESDTDQKRLLSSPMEDRSKRQRTSNSPRRSHRVRGQPSNYTFCTQSCLRGLRAQSELDDKCPNVNLHRRHSNNGRHPISRDVLVELIDQQLHQNLDSCSPMGKEGLHGSLFAIQLQTHGYTVIGKGTEYHSRHEGTIYSRLKSLQGSAIPVYLGDIDMRNVYYTDSGREIIHMSLMAWGGRTLRQPECPGLKEQIESTKTEVYNSGVVHLDLRAANFLWNEEMKRVMLIDFSRATIHKKRRSSAVLSPSKRDRPSVSVSSSNIVHPMTAGRP